MSLAMPWMLLLVIPAIAIAAFVLVAMRRNTAAARGLSRTIPPGPRYAATVLLLGAMLAATIAAAGPRWGERPVPIVREGVDVMFIVDVSRSMDVQDVGGSRLEQARAAIDASLEAVEGGRAGLVIFGGSATVRFPLTTDAAAASGVLRTLEAGQLYVEPGSSIAAGLETAITAFDEASEAGRAAVLLSDGDDLGSDPSAIAQEYLANDITLLVAGIGTVEGGNVPVYDRARGESVPMAGTDGEPVVSAINEPLLLDIARAADGRYLGTSLDSLPGALGGRIASLQQARFDERDGAVPVERFQWFAAACLVLLFGAIVTDRMRIPRRRVTGVGAAAGSVLLLFLAACDTPAHRANERGLEAFDEGRFDEAIAHFEEAREEAPADDQVALNLAAALHAAESYDAAERAAGQALDAPGPAVRAEAHSAVGHARFARDDLAGALDAFRSALREDPLPAHRRNYEVVLQLLEPPAEPEATPEPSPGAAPGVSPTPDAEQQPGGSASPGPGDDGEPGDAEPTSGPGDSEEGEPVSGDSDGTGRPGTTSELDAEITAIDEEIESLIPEPGDELGPADADRILELLAERARLAILRDTYRDSVDPGDY